MMRNTETGEISGKLLQNNILKVDNDTWRLMFPGAELDTIKQAANALAIMQSGVGKGTPGAMIAQFTQAGVLNLAFTGGLFYATGNEQLSAGFLLLSPLVLARLITNPRFARHMAIGARVKPGTKAAVEAATNLSALVTRETARVSQLSKERQRKEQVDERFRTAGYDPRTGMPQQ